ncbi:MAG: Minf_1886 family protein [Verrucomicrobiota bacterium]|jgi:uncharacterized repeat protein (TIGR04138 family)
MQPLNFDEVLETILTKDPRYHRDAYYFLRAALDHTQKLVTKANRSEPRHVTGQELLEGIRDFALGQFGPMTQTVFNEWGIYRTEDFGDMVFNMVEQGLLSKTDSDRREDFKNAYEFEEAFRKPFMPSSRLNAVQRETRPSEV